MSGRKCKGIRVLSDEGYAKNQERNGSMIEQVLCRFNFPKYPLDKTEVLYAILVNLNSGLKQYFQYNLNRMMKKQPIQGTC